MVRIGSSFDLNAPVLYWDGADALNAALDAGHQGAAEESRPEEAAVMLIH
jgi:hypothetical protein